MQDIKKWIKCYEGLKLDTYIDTTGHLTVGWGRNLVNGINLDEAELMFENDFKRTIDELETQLWYIHQPQNVKNALINMNFNLGIHKLLEFKDMVAALARNDYSTAATEALNSLWAKQVGERAKDIALMMRQG